MSVEGESEASVTRKSMAMPLGMASQTWSFWGRAKAPKARQNNNNPRLPSVLSCSLTAGPKGSEGVDDDASRSRAARQQRAIN